MEVEDGVGILRRHHILGGRPAEGILCAKDGLQPELVHFDRNRSGLLHIIVNASVLVDNLKPRIHRKAAPRCPRLSPRIAGGKAAARFVFIDPRDVVDGVGKAHAICLAAQSEVGSDIDGSGTDIDARQDVPSFRDIQTIAVHQILRFRQGDFEIIIAILPLDPLHARRFIFDKDGHGFLLRLGKAILGQRPDGAGFIVIAIEAKALFAAVLGFIVSISRQFHRQIHGIFSHRYTRRAQVVEGERINRVTFYFTQLVDRDSIVLHCNLVWREQLDFTTAHPAEYAIEHKAKCVFSIICPQ